MAEVLVEYADVVTAPDGRRFTARACGSEYGSHLWQGWLEFLPLDEGEPVRSGRETTQPNRQDTEYWATGLTPVYLEGALSRTLTPAPKVGVPPAPAPIFDGPATEALGPAPATESILNPFSVYRKGEALLRNQLNALSAWHLVNAAVATNGLKRHGRRNMVTHMKTTIDIADDLLLRSKRLARERHVTLRTLMLEGLRRVLENEKPAQPFKVKPVTFKGKGLAPDFQNALWNTVRDAAYKGHGT